MSIVAPFGKPEGSPYQWRTGIAYRVITIGSLPLLPLPPRGPLLSRIGG